MAQSAGRSKNRHGFIFSRTSSHNFGKITSMATTTRGNLLICDNLEKTITLLDPQGDYLSYIKLDWSPYDIDISQSNECIVTAPSDRRVIHLDPDQLVIRTVEQANDPNTQHDRSLDVTSLSFQRDSSLAVLLSDGRSAYAYERYSSMNDLTSDLQWNCLQSLPSKIQAAQHRDEIPEIFAVSCSTNDIFITKSDHYGYKTDTPINIPSIDGITDICIDDNNHVYLAGLFSNTVHRLTQDGSVLDIPLTQANTQGLQSPTAITFNQSYTKLYVATEWGKKVMVFDVV